MIAALFVEPRGVYADQAGVDPWPADRDARRYTGPWPVVAHPPCAAWGAYAKPRSESRARGPLLGADGGCFAAALASVERYGGVLEHPAGSRAWSHPAAGTGDRPLPVPSAAGWTRALHRPGWVCSVDQGHYGHAARKPTWLYYVGPSAPPDLTWGPSAPAAIGTGARRGNLESLSKIQRAATPAGFARLLEDLARGTTDHACRCFDPDSNCPVCQVVWAEYVEAMSRPGANVRVTLPSDVAPWFDETAVGASWTADVYQSNGDSIDVFTPDGDVEPVDIAYCRPWRPGTYTAPGASS